MAPRNPFDPTGEKRLAALALEEQVVNLIRAGFSQHGVARKLGKSVSGVNKALRRAEARAKNRIVESVTILREKQAGQLDAWQDKLVEAFNAGQVTIADLIDKGVKLQDRKAKLLGLDAPTKTEHGEAGAFETREQIYSNVQEKLDELMGKDKPQPPPALALPAPAHQTAAAPANNAPGPVPAADNSDVSDAAERVAATLDALRSRQGRLPEVAPPDDRDDDGPLVLEAEIVGPPSFMGVRLDAPNHHPARLPVSLPPFHPRSNFRNGR